MTTDGGKPGRGQKRGRGHQDIPIKGWKFRYDAPPDPPIAGAESEGDVLNLFRIWGAHRGSSALAPNRRAATRYAPAEARAWVGWWKGTRFLIREATLLNLGAGGALIDLPDHPPSSQPVWLCVGEPGPAAFAQARVQEVHTPTMGEYRVRLTFHLPCPRALFLAAGQGPEGPATAPPD